MWRSPRTTPWPSASNGQHETTASTSQAVRKATPRNYGLDHAWGEYLVVIDGDDWIAMEMLERLAAKLKETGPLDILAFAAERVFPPYEKDITPIGQDIITNFRETDDRPLQVLGTGGYAAPISPFCFQVNDYTWLNLYRMSLLRETTCVNLTTCFSKAWNGFSGFSSRHRRSPICMNVSFFIGKIQTQLRTNTS